MEKYFGDKAHSLSDLNMVEDIRNIGMVAGIELSKRNKSPTTLGRDVFEKCFEYGVMVRFTGNTIALSPPLIVSKNEIDQMFSTLRKAIREAF